MKHFFGKKDLDYEIPLTGTMWRLRNPVAILSGLSSGIDKGRKEGLLYD
jgi:hypothetical protein